MWIVSLFANGISAAINYGKPFTVDGFSQWMRDAITDAGLSLDCQPHRLRKAAGRRLAEAGATAKMIMAILGHTNVENGRKTKMMGYGLALPREAREVNKLNSLRKGLGK